MDERRVGGGHMEAPVDLGDTDAFTLRLLEPGFVWFFAVQTRDDWARLSRAAVGLPVLVSDFTDADRDGMPDDWETAYLVSEPNLDEDGDGLPNGEEVNYGTHPRFSDTDGDGFSDGAEVAGGSPPLDANATPATYENFTSGLLPLPDLSVAPHWLTFHAYTAGANPAAQTVSVLNLGGGTLAPAISDNAAWLSTALIGDALSVSVNKTGLPAGHYQALITVAGAPGSLTQNSPQTVSVDLWLIEGAPLNSTKIFLPSVMK
jgi:hypothetical protein